MKYGLRGEKLIPGVNVDELDIPSGLRELIVCGYTEERTLEVVHYALQRWARGEEEAAERGAIDRSFHGIDFGSWRRVLAAAMAGAAAAKVEEMSCPHPDVQADGICVTCEHQVRKPQTLVSMVSVWIDDDFLAEIDAADESAHNWTPESIASWGLVIAGESHPDTEGVVHLGNDGGKNSRHVGRWKVY